MEQRDSFNSYGNITEVKRVKRGLDRMSIEETLSKLTHIFRTEWRFSWWSSCKTDGQSEAAKKGPLAANWEERMTVHVARHKEYKIGATRHTPFGDVQKFQ